MPTEKQLNNLKPLNQRAKSVQREISSKGGKARAKKMKERKTFQDACITVLKMALSNDDLSEITDIASLEDVKGKNVDIQAAIILKQAQLALKGNTRAAEFLRDSSGQKPKETIDLNNSVIVDDKVKALQEHMKRYEDDGA